MNSWRRKYPAKYEIVALLFEELEENQSPLPLEDKIAGFFNHFLGSEEELFITFPWVEIDAYWAVTLISSEAWDNLDTNPYMTAKLYGLNEIGVARERIATRKYNASRKELKVILDRELAEISFRLTVMGATPENHHNIRHLAGRNIVLALASQF